MDLTLTMHQFVHSTFHIKKCSVPTSHRIPPQMVFSKEFICTMWMKRCSMCRNRLFSSCFTKEFCNGTVSTSTLETTDRQLDVKSSRSSVSNPKKKEIVGSLALLKICANDKDLYRGIRLHAAILRKGLIDKSPKIGSALVSMYAKCGALEIAKQVLDGLPSQDSVSWNALIGGYVQQGMGKEGLDCFQQMQRHGLSPNTVTFLCLLKACVSMKDVEEGRKVHEEIVNKGLLLKENTLGNALVDMYCKCGALSKAQEVLDELPVRDVISWNGLITGYAQQEQGEKSLQCFHHMQREGISPDVVTLSCILRVCGSLGNLEKGQQIHDEIADKGLLGNDIVLGTALIDMYAKCGTMVKAQKVHDELPIRNLVSWNALIAGYVQQDEGMEALSCYGQMQNEGISPDAITFSSILKACGSIRDINKGKQIHEEVVNKGMLVKDVVLGTALVNMYVKCGSLSEARHVLHKLPARNLSLWNALIVGYVQQGKNDEALNCFEQLRSEGVSPDSITFSCALKACGNTLSAEKGKQIHEEISRKGLLKNDVVLATALVDMYVKLKYLERAQEVLDKFLYCDVIAWNTLIAGYAEQGKCDEAINCLRRMQKEGFSPNCTTFSYILQACSNSGSIDKGEHIHKEIVDNGLLIKHNVLGNALVDMYVKCGALEKAEQVLNELIVRDIVSWNALMTGYAQRGMGDKALDCFSRMQQDGLSPDSVTFLCVLTACSHSGLVDLGEMYYIDMQERYGIIPELEHHTCMVDLLGRSGQFNKAVEVIKKMPSSDYYPVWAALLGACQKWGNVKLGRWAFEQAIQVDCKNTTAFVVMINIYTAAGMPEEAEEVEAFRWKLQMNSSECIAGGLV